MNLKALTSPWYIQMIGLPGTGKSTIVNEMGSLGYVNLLSTDNYIEAYAHKVGKTYSEVFKSQAKFAQDDFNEKFAEAVLERESIIHDQTNLTRKKRVSFLGRLPDCYYKIGVVCLVNDVVEHQRRLDSRPGKIIGPEIISHMKKSFDEPHKDEGFDSLIWNIYEFGDTWEQ